MVYVLREFKMVVHVFPTQGRVIPFALVESDDGVWDRHISIERTKAAVSSFRNGDGNVWVHGGFESHFNAS